MVKSMTGFATLAGEAQGWSWVWEIRAVNARGLDIRLRIPDWLSGIDQIARTEISKTVKRGSVSLGLKINRLDQNVVEALDMAALDRAIEQLKQVEETALDAGLTLTPLNAADLLSQRGVVTISTAEDDVEGLQKILLGQLPGLIATFQAMRETEGGALLTVLQSQLDQIATLTEQAHELADARKDQWAARLQENLARALANADGADPDRIAQEIAMIVVKSDVTEETDRLLAHVTAAKDLLNGKAPVGRKLDFLSQEFNREANTLCSKAQSNALTRVGLDLKATIDQMREQVQNVE